MDRDEESIGGIRNPMAPTRQLYIVSVVLDVAGLLLSLLVSPLFALLYGVYIIFSRLYSYRGIRLKQYPLTGYVTVVLNQGALTFYMVFYAVSLPHITAIPWTGLIISTLLIGAFYPITQIYQHKQDIKDGVRTISYMLGVRGTFIYCALLYMVSFLLLAQYFIHANHLYYFLILQAWFLPIIIRFVWWTWVSWKNENAANFVNTMRMNWLAATCTNLAFISLIIIKHIG
jgi:1,4-dihydroxy-2-naphthoate octaprenyltransferase